MNTEHLFRLAAISFLILLAIWLTCLAVARWYGNRQARAQILAAYKDLDTDKRTVNRAREYKSDRTLFRATVRKARLDKIKIHHYKEIL